jgi:hypothetical protein
MPASALTPTIFWNIDTNGDWATAADWSTGKLPAASDNVGINTDTLHTISFSELSATVLSLTVGNDDFSLSSGTLTIKNLASFANQLSLSGGTLSIGGQGAAVGSFVQQGGALYGSGTITIAGSAAFSGTDTQSGAGTTILQGSTTINAVLTPEVGRTIENKGTLKWTGGFWQPDNATFKNTSGAVLNIEGGVGINNAAGTNIFINAGTLNIGDVNSAGTVIYVPLTNTGTIAVKSGTLTLSGGGSTTAGTITVAARATLTFNIGFPFNGPQADPTFTMKGGSFDNLGMLNISAGTLNLGAVKVVNLGAQGVSVGGLLGGELELGANNTTLSSLTLTSISVGQGQVDGSGILTITGKSTFQGGLLSGSGTTLLKGRSTVTGTYLHLSGGRILENRNTMTVEGTAFTLNKATLKNDVGATLIATSPILITTSTGLPVSGGGNSFINNGKIELGTGGWQVVVQFINSGTISLGTGALQLFGAGNTLSGTMTGTGTVFLSSLGSPTLLTTSVANLTIAGGATLSNADSVTETANVVIAKGSITNTAKGSWSITNGAILSGSGIFTNQGTLEKSAGAGPCRVELATVNDGSIEATSGTLELYRAISGTGTLMVGNGAQLVVDGAVGTQQTATFNALGGTLVLADIAGFGASVVDFGDQSPSASDSIELASFGYRKSEAVSFKENAAKTGGKLTITDGKLQAAIILFGQYISNGFHLAANHAGETLITYERPPTAAAVSLASPHG